MRDLERSNSERQKVEMMIARDWKKGKMGSYCLMAREFKLEMKKFWRWMEVMGVQHCKGI